MNQGKDVYIILGGEAASETHLTWRNGKFIHGMSEQRVYISRNLYN